ncbi:chromatin structure-remodeling complex protein SYD isoform X28 [Arachis duranensis]|uniref:Chromatin structure-remodeling complex protein SYD isoform X28 n=1 Tax=Arachis duranensis TaxID=130453 RepID=A0A9C6TXT8_ARADU|nr:chromatin structure-remodeling complex protein SYD isoform X28 [Arachis duranensis]
MASSQNVELEAAKFLHKLIQDSKDEPAKLATKLCVILQHMKSSGKEHSMPYQVISRAMETVINQHNLDIEALKSSRPPSSGAGSSQRGTSQAVGVATDSRAGLPENVMPKMDSFASGRPPYPPSIGAPDHYQGSAAQRSGQSFDHGSPSSLDSRSANSQSRDRRDTTNLDKQVNQKDGRKATSKRKRGDTLSPAEPHVDIPSHLDQRNTANTRKGKMTKAESSDGLPVRSGELTNFNRVPSSSQMQRANQEGPTKIGNPVPCAPNSKYPEDTEVSSAHIASGKLQGAHPMVHGGMGVATSAYPMTESVLSSSMRHGGMLGHYSGSSTTSADEPKIGLTDRHSSNSEITMLRQGVPPRDMARSTISGSSGVPFKEQQLKQLRAQCLVFLAFRNGLAPKQLHLEIALGTAFSREGKDHTDHKGKSQSSVELGTSSGAMMPFGGLNNMRQPDNNNSSGSPSAGKSLEATSFCKGTESAIMTGDKGILSEERKHLLAVKKVELEKQIQERAGAQASSATSFQQQDSSSTKGDVDSGNLQVGLSNRPSSVIGLNKQMNPEINGFTGFASSDEASEGPSQVSSLQHELPIERRDNVVNQFQNMVNSGGSRNHHSLNHLTYALKEHLKPVPGTGIDPQGASLMKDADLLAKNVSSDGFKTVPVNDASRHDATFSTDIEENGRLPPPKYTMSGRWIMDQQKKRLLVQQNWVQKQQKTKQIMTTCFLKLKENVSSSEDISAKTKSVIELKKLQLLDLQRRLRSDFLNDFFKPITTEMEQLKSVKKHRHGRRVKQLERYEHKMREERQKRIRERQKEFFSEIEVHKEKLDDVFKIKRERWKGVNRYVKEYHKRKERIHREKIDRIQREKINLLKINDVEGYLRMVQDAKSDRVKQLLKETEKYLQKLGSKLQEAKTAAGRFEHDIDEAQCGSFLDKSESTLENEDEGDQAKNNLEELWALLNFLLPNIFNSSEDFSQWFNKPFESAGDNSPDEALLSEEENLLIINRLHQVLRPFVLRRLKHKVENELPEKIERLVRCEASAYQKLLMKRVEENLGSIGTTKARSVHNSVMELRNICNHPYLSQLHAEEVDNFIPRHYLPPIIRLCGKLEMLDRILPKLKAADHRVLFFSTMTRLLDVMEEYLTLKQHRYLRLDGHTSGGDRGALIDLFNQPGSPYFIFLLSIRAGGVGVNLQAADTVIIFDTDWNPQVDLQAQARAHRIGQKKDVLVLRFETVQTVEEQVRASAEHKLGVANQSITAGFFDNNTSAEDRREYLESLLRECKKEEAAPVLDDDALNDLLARSEAEIDVFEAVDQKRREDEMATWKKLVSGPATDGSEPIPTLPSRLVTDEDLKQFYEAMKIFDVSKDEVASNGIKRKSGTPGGLDTQHYGRGKRAREVRSYEEQWTEEEFDKMCKAESPGSPKVMEEVIESNCKTNASSFAATASVTETAVVPPVAPATSSLGSLPVHKVKDITPPAKRGRGRPRRITSDKLPVTAVPLATSGTVEVDMQVKEGTLLGQVVLSTLESISHSSEVIGVSGPAQQSATGVSPNLTTPPNSQAEGTTVSVPIQTRGQGRKSQGGGEATRRRGKKQVLVLPPVSGVSIGPDLKMNEQLEHKPLNPSAGEAISQGDTVSSSATVQHSSTEPGSVTLSSGGDNKSGVGIALSSQQPLPLSSVTPVPQTVPTYPSVPIQNDGQHQKPQNGSGAPRRRGKKKAMVLPIPDVSGSQNLHLTSNLQSSSGNVLHDKATELKSLQDSLVQESHSVVQDHASHSIVDKDLKSTEVSGDIANKALVESTTEDNTKRSPGLEIEKVQNSDMHGSASIHLSNTLVLENSRNKSFCDSTLPVTEVTRDQQLEAKTHHCDEASKPDTFPVHSTKETKGSSNKAVEPMAAQAVPNASDNAYPSISGSESIQPCPPESMPVKRQGRKTQNRVEPPRRRGRKSSSASPVVSDSLATQDPNLNNDFQKSSVESSVGKVATDVAQAQAFQILLPSGGAAHDLNTKEGAAISSLNKQQKVAPGRVDSAPVSSDKITAFGRMQNVNDVARVMKEVFSGTCLPKPKAADSAAGELLKTNTTIDSMNTQLNADKAGYDITNSEAACLTPGIAVNIQEKESEGEFNNQKLEDKASSDIPNTGAVDVSNNMCLRDKTGKEHDKQSEVSDMQILESKENSDMPTTGAVNRNERQLEETSTTLYLEGKAASDKPTTGVVDAFNFQCSENKTDSDMSATEVEFLISDLPVNTHEKQSVEALNIRNLEDKASLDILTTEAACPDLDHAVNKYDKEVMEASNIQILEDKVNSDMPTAGVVVTSNDQFLEVKAGMDEPTSGAACLTSDLSINQREQLEEASSIQKPDVESSSDVPATGGVSASNIQCSEDKPYSEISAGEDGCATVDLAVNGKEKQSEEESNIQNLGNKISSDMPTTGALCLTPIIPTDGNVQLSEPPSDQEITALNEPLPSAMEVDTPICDDIKEKQDHIQHCTKTCSNQSEVEALDATPLSSAVRTECLSESSTKSSPLASSGENMSDQPQVIPSCPLTPTVSKELVNSPISKSCEINYRNEVNCSMQDSDLLERESQITVGNNSQNALELAIEQNALSPSETEATNVALSGKYLDALKHAELHENPLVKSCSQSLSEGKMNMGDFICEQPVSAVDISSNIDPVPKENVISAAAIGDTNVDSSVVCPMNIDTSLSNQVTIVQDNEIVTKSCRQDVDTSSADEVEKIIDQSPDEPVDRSVLQQTSGSKAVANSSVDASQSVLVEEGTISETAILPSSSFSIDDNKVSSKTCAISNSETLEEAMEEGATDRSEFLPPEKGAEESCRNATEVPSTVPVLLQESIDSEGDHRDQGKSQVGGIPENHETGMLAAPKTSEGGNEVETFSDKGPLGSSDAWDESKGLADMENQTEAIQNHAAEIDVPCTSASGDKAEGEPKGLADMENQAEAIQNRSAEMDVLCLSASGVKAEGESKEVADMENRAEAIQNCAAEMDVPCTSAPGDKAEGESKGLADMENLAEAIQDCAAEMHVPCVSSPGDKAEGEYKGLADMENEVETIESCAAEMEVSCSSASGDKAEGENVLVGTKEKILVSEDTEAFAVDETDVSNGGPAVPETTSANGAPLPCSSLRVGEPFVGHDTKGTETGVANHDNQAIRQNALKDAEECSSSAAADIIEKSSPQKDVIESSPLLPLETSVDGVPPPCSSVAEGERVESLSDEALVDSAVKLGTKNSEASQDNLVLQENALNEMEKTLPSATEDRVAVCSPEKDNLTTACSEAPQESEKYENVQNRSEEEPGQSSVAEETKKD